MLSGPSSATTGSLLAEVSGPLRTLSGDSGAWAGPVGLFAAGNGLLELRAAAVLRANSRASAQGALAQLAAALGSQASPTRVSGAERALAIHLHGLPLELVAATGTGIDGSSDLIVGAGAASVELALKPPQAMRGSPAAQAARQALGGLEPTLVVDVPTLLGTLESLQVTGEPLLKGATPYLQKVTTLDAGIGSAAPGNRAHANRRDTPRLTRRATASVFGRLGVRCEAAIFTATTMRMIASASRPASSPFQPIAQRTIQRQKPSVIVITRPIGRRSYRPADRAAANSPTSAPTDAAGSTPSPAARTRRVPTITPSAPA